MSSIEPMEIELGSQSSPNSVRRALQQQHDVIRQAIAAFERARHPYRMILTWKGFSETTDAHGACGVLEGLLADFVPAPDGLRAVGARWIQDRSEPRVTLNLAEDVTESAPAGALLLERTMPTDVGLSNAGDLAADIRKTLEDHVMAHTDSEYMLAVDVPMQAEGHSRAALLRGLALTRSAIGALPAEASRQPNVRELQVRLRDEDGSTRLRIWRLGFMKVPGSSRVA